MSDRTKCSCCKADRPVEEFSATKSGKQLKTCSPCLAKLKKTRDATWVGQRDGLTLNHTTGIACLGGAALDSEECYLIAKAMRALGVIWLEHQARI